MQLSKKYYKKLLDEHKLEKKYVKNALMAFLFGGMVAVFGQVLLEIFSIFDIKTKDAITCMLLCVITISIILSALGIYDKAGQVGKCGLVIPIPGFANSMASSAMEYKPEGFILGVGANTFKLAGTVIIFGVFSGFFVGLIKYLVSFI
jgi:stage V sporulation protein AC